MRFINRKTLAFAGAAAALVALGSTTTAVAGNLIGSADIQDGSVRSVDIKDGGIHESDLGDRLTAKIGKDGKDGKDGKNGLDGAVYRVANYTGGGGGRATVACGDTEAVSKQYTAIAGGARTEVPGAGTNTEAIVSSFPGRMDWSAGTNGGLPKPNRLDGWVVYFDGAAAPTGAAGNALEIWALCVPTASITTQVTNY
jgi:hypothetical protein